MKKRNIVNLIAEIAAWIVVAVLLYCVFKIVDPIKRYNITKITRNRFRLKLMIFKNIKNKLFSFTNGVKTPTNAYGNKTIRSRKKVTLKIF